MDKPLFAALTCQSADPTMRGVMVTQKKKTFLNLCLVFSVLATIIAGHLLWATTVGQSGVYGCGEGSACDDVLGSRWSLWLNLPVTIFALPFYLVLCAGLIALRAPRSVESRWPRWLVTVSCSAGLIMLWFLGLQAFAIGSFCIYCISDHVLGLLAISCLVTHAARSGAMPGTIGWILSPAIAAGFITLHVMVEPTRMATEDAPAPETVPAIAAQPSAPARVTANPSTILKEPSRRVSILNNAVQFDIYRIPHVGNSQAEHIALELFDYTCKYCREFHKKLKPAMARYGDQLAVVMLPVPMHSACNPNIRVDRPVHQFACPLAELALAVCLADREQFGPYHSWLMKSKDAPAPDAARTQAEALVGAESLAEALQSRWVKDWLADGRALHGLGNIHGIPKLLVGGQIANIRTVAQDELHNLLETELGIKPIQDL